MAEISVWTPSAGGVRLWLQPAGQVGQRLAMRRRKDGWWWLDCAAVAGTDYGFLLDDDPMVLPDPRSRRQGAGVHGLSRIYIDNLRWSDGAWGGRALPGAVIYELHVGTFTAEGTFDGVASRLDHLVWLGVTHVELLPVNDFDGIWDWGYDGVLWHAVLESYGGPDSLKRHRGCLPCVGSRSSSTSFTATSVRAGTTCPASDPICGTGTAPGMIRLISTVTGPVRTADDGGDEAHLDVPGLSN